MTSDLGRVSNLVPSESDPCMAPEGTMPEAAVFERAHVAAANKTCADGDKAGQDDDTMVIYKGGGAAARSGKADVLSRIEPFGPDGTPQDFHWTTQPISHPMRRRLILEKYPEIEKLYGYDLREAALAVGCVVLNIYLGFKLVDMNLSWAGILLATLLLSGTINHSLFLSMHEASHTALFPKRWMNEWYVVFSNLSMGTPAGMGFIRYHLDHHVYMGVDMLDPDIPTELEGRMFKSRLGKFLWVLLFPATYTLRPMLRNPKKLIFMEIVNWVVVIVWDVYVFRRLGFKGLMYFVGGSIFSMSFHPLNGHLIAEHYQFPDGEKLQETYSTYGWENLLTYNAGYHLEHHDFPRVPGFKLPELHRIAREFYDLPHHTTWIRVVWDFIMKKEVGPFSRVKRVAPRGGQVPYPHQQYVDDESKHLGIYWSGPKKRVACREAS